MGKNQILLLAIILTPVLTYAKPEVYLGLNLGYGKIKATSSEIKNNQITVSETRNGGLAGGVDVGLLWSTNNLKYSYGLEAGYYKYRKSQERIVQTGFEDTPDYLTFSGHHIDLLSVGTVNYANWSLIGKLGAAYVTQHSKLDRSFDKTKSRLFPKAAAGVEYRLDQNVHLNLMYSHIFAQKATAVSGGNPSHDLLSRINSVDMLTLGLRFKF